MTDAGARGAILAAIRAALTDVAATERPDDVAVPRRYAQSSSLGAAGVLKLFTERVRDYRATVVSVPSADVGIAVAQRLVDVGAQRVVVPAGVPERWRTAPVEWLVDDGGLPAEVIAGADAAVTGSAAAIGETGTFVLDGGPASGRRIVSLLPDVHICVVVADHVVATVPEALARLDRTAPLTFVSGPSATSDIELSRVEGVHGPRTLAVVIVDG